MSPEKALLPPIPAPPDGERTTERSEDLILLVGAPNVGKSALFNRLTGAYVTVSNYPGTTVEVTRGTATYAQTLRREGEESTISRKDAAVRGWDDSRPDASRPPGGEEDSLGNWTWEVVDTPGMYSLLSMTEEERVARSILFRRRPRAVLHVIDAKNLERHLPLTIQLEEAGVPLIVVLNMMDELDSRGMEIDVPALSNRLGVPVIPTVSVEGKGIDDLKDAIARVGKPNGRRRGPTPPAEDASRRVGDVSALVTDTRSRVGDMEARPRGTSARVEHARSCCDDAIPAVDPRPALLRIEYGDDIDADVAALIDCFPGGSAVTPRSLALLALQGDEEVREWWGEEAWEELPAHESGRAHSMRYRIASRRQREASRIAAGVTRVTGPAKATFASRLSALLINPWTGFPVLVVVLYLGLYKFVGEFGAGVCVDFLEHRVFEAYVNPFVVHLVDRFVSWGVLRELIAGEYGVFTLGVRYAVAIILPIVTFFFLIFAIMEDTGYLPRLALLIDRMFKKIGLSGRGVIPIVLGLGCDSMATIVTRTLPTKRERVIGTLLLALAVPCSAQLGVILALLQGRPAALAVWAGVVILVFLFTGFLAARIVPGDRPRFYIELPPLRLPRPGNVFMKTYTRVHWYVKEVFPVFILASVLIWAGRLTGVFDWLVGALAYPVRWMGLPPDAATVFLFGFFRRDYGAAGLYDLNSGGALDWIQLTVATVALTLFLPCIAQFLINVKERGARIGIGISIFILFFSFGVAVALNQILRAVAG